MKHFEYQAIRISFGDAQQVNDVLNTLNGLGNQGWELVSALSENPVNGILFLKREVED